MSLCGAVSCAAQCGRRDAGIGIAEAQLGQFFVAGTSAGAGRLNLFTCLADRKNGESHQNKIDGRAGVFGCFHCGMALSRAAGPKAASEYPQRT
jgi:hypothetical protein